MLPQRWLNTVDVFVAGKDEWTRAQLERSEESPLPGVDRSLRVATAEDTVLAKLVWYREGNEVSDRQWHDVLGVLRASGAQLDADYMSSWAMRLGVSDLLDRALAEAVR